MTDEEKAEFNAYCRTCTDDELRATLAAERKVPGHQAAVIIAKQEMIIRGIK